MDKDTGSWNLKLTATFAATLSSTLESIRHVNRESGLPSVRLSKSLCKSPNFTFNKKTTPQWEKYTVLTTGGTGALSLF